MLEFVRLKEEHLQMVLDWRVKPEVTRYMFTDIDQNMANQRRWFERISSDESCRHWVIQVDNKPIGLVYLEHLDRANNRSSWGYFIGEDDYRKLGGLIPLYLYSYCFNQLGFKKLTAEIIDGNDNIIKLHRLHGYREVGTYKNHVLKYGKYHDVHVLELHAGDWAAVQKSPEKNTAEFED
jgi:UDP-4-amino-4,6-dideoxy-N-acetyl-beta-L-altrosamine N-acetyltransferase